MPGTDISIVLTKTYTEHQAPYVLNAGARMFTKPFLDKLVKSPGQRHSGLDPESTST
jgi:hypothetical protein